MTITASDLPRSTMLDVTKKLSENLKARKKKGPKEDALDGFIPELDAVAETLGTHVEGKAASDAARLACVLQSDVADDQVDTWFRHCHAFVSVAARRRTGEHRDGAATVEKAAFPDGLAHVDDYIPTENSLCRASIAAMRSPAHHATLQGIQFPLPWLDAWELSIVASDEAFSALEKARLSKSKHVGGAQDAEAEFAELVVRLRKIVGGRARRNDKDKLAEGKELLQPLSDALKKAATEKAARTTREAKTAAASSEPSTPIALPTGPGEPAPMK